MWFPSLSSIVVFYCVICLIILLLTAYYYTFSEMQSLLEKGYELVSGGTDNHLVLVNLRNKVEEVFLPLVTVLSNYLFPLQEFIGNMARCVCMLDKCFKNNFPLIYWRELFMEQLDNRVLKGKKWPEKFIVGFNEIIQLL